MSARTVRKENMTELEQLKDEVTQLKDDVADIRDNHLTSIEAYILAMDAALSKEIGNVRWFVGGTGGLLGIVIALCQLLG